MTLAGGIALLARGRARGLAAFGATAQAFLSSLAPLLAFPLVGSLLLALRGDLRDALVELLETLAVLLAPPVVAWEFARRWGREAAWLRFATAFGWCQWAVPIVAALVMLAGATLMLVGLSRDGAAALVVLALACYALWLHWFLVRCGLGISGLRAVLVVLAMNLATAAIVLGVPGLAQSLAHAWVRT
jgi:hypothetical protein